MVERPYRINYLPEGSTPREILTSAPIPGEARVVVPTVEFDAFAALIRQEADGLGGKAVVFSSTFPQDSEHTFAIASWREVRPDKLGSRFVQMVGPAIDRYEFETPFARFLTKALETRTHFRIPKRLKEAQWDRMIDIMIVSTFGKREGKDGSLEQRFSLERIGEIFLITERF